MGQQIDNCLPVAKQAVLFSGLLGFLVQQRGRVATRPGA